MVGTDYRDEQVEGEKVTLYHREDGRSGVGERKVLLTLYREAGEEEDIKGTWQRGAFSGVFA
jgi:hypothetical protein